jgi:hypothetical protein
LLLAGCHGEQRRTRIEVFAKEALDETEENIGG